MNKPTETPAEPNARATLIRDVIVFQGKLIVDGLRDLVLVPASLVAGIISLASGSHSQPGTQFYRLLGVGKNSGAMVFDAAVTAVADRLGRAMTVEQVEGTLAWLDQARKRSFTGVFK